jgi:tetratricopeptide (TPR) repeat protein
MAEVMMKEGRIRQAINKYNMVAKAYLVREENDRAASILYEVLEMAPLDTDVRISLIHLLEEENRMEEALDQYIDLAETYQQLGDFERANQTFEAASKMAADTNAAPGKIVQIKHFIADINQMRLNTREAQRIYEEILTVKSDDEKALRGLIDIYYTQGNQVEAVKRLDVLLSFYAKSGEVIKIEQMLEELVNTNPSDGALRQRLASIYRRRGRKREAIEQLDALGELQLDAGLTKDAAQTIKQIIAMGPDRLDDYKRLLSQLGG